MSDKTYDVLIVGGGYAGLSTALAMCRTGASTAVFDDQTYRNKDADYMHKLVTWDHRHPSEFRDAARKEIGEGRYDTATLVEQGVGIDEVWRISDKPTMFGLKDTTGKIWKGRKLVLATGAQPVIPDVPGFRDCYPKSMYVFVLAALEMGCNTCLSCLRLCLMRDSDIMRSSLDPIPY